MYSFNIIIIIAKIVKLITKPLIIGIDDPAIWYILYDVMDQYVQYRA